jgi:hypothetical protein
VTDAEREATVEILRRALAEGSLTVAETEQRIGATYAARRGFELHAQLSDLPQAQPTWLPRARISRRSTSLVLIPVVAMLALTVAFATGHVFFPLIPLAFLGLRVWWWRSAWPRPGGRHMLGAGTAALGTHSGPAKR